MLKITSISFACIHFQSLWRGVPQGGAIDQMSSHAIKTKSVQLTTGVSNVLYSYGKYKII